MLCSYTAGPSLGMDATFKMAKQVTKSLARSFVSALSDMGHIIGYAAVPSEAWATLLPFLVGWVTPIVLLVREAKVHLSGSDPQPLQ